MAFYMHSLIADFCCLMATERGCREELGPAPPRIGSNHGRYPLAESGTEERVARRQQCIGRVWTSTQTMGRKTRENIALVKNRADFEISPIQEAVTTGTFLKESPGSADLSVRVQSPRA
jgi:hypothetical protein